MLKNGMIVGIWEALLNQENDSLGLMGGTEVSLALSVTGATGGDVCLWTGLFTLLCFLAVWFEPSQQSLSPPWLSVWPHQ